MIMIDNQDIVRLRESGKRASVLLEHNAELGEGPVWIPETNKLLWTDIEKGEVNSLNITDCQNHTIYRGNNPSCIFPTTKNEILIADKERLFFLNLENLELKEFITITHGDSNIRFNDGKVDPLGRIWIGTLSTKIDFQKGALYSVDSSGQVTERLRNITISNGLTWSLNNDKMYFIDSWERAIYEFYLKKNGDISNKKVLVKFAPSLGIPDGMTIDANGYLWVAMWGGFSVICFDPNKRKLIERIYVEAPNVTSLAFGGKDLESLFITTARQGLAQEVLESFPSSGSIFSVETGSRGVVCNKWRYS
jgi:sugar lactone lactonase YvrE